MESSYLSASDGHTWANKLSSSLVMFLLKIGFLVVLDFPYLYPVWLRMVPVPTYCFTWVLLPIVMFLILMPFSNNVETNFIL